MNAGLYVHIPFCVRKCAYCDFVSFADMTNMRAYLDALDIEISMRSNAGIFSCFDFDTVFIGGGTPSVLPPKDIAHIMDRLHASFDIAPNAEISIETNPGTLDMEKLRIYKECGINRVSMGLQSSSDGLLSRIGRIHTYSDFLDSYKLARKAGFDNINVDIMYGLPGQSPGQHEDTLRRLCVLAPRHISAYSLILEEGTPLFDKHDDLPDEDECFDMHLLTRQFLSENGYTRYEISNYAQSGFECRHNLHYWNAEPYLGLGLNSHSAWRVGNIWTRFANTANLGEYIGMLASGKLAEATREDISLHDEMFECVMLGLRKVEGLERAAFLSRFGKTLDQVYPAAIAALREQGFLCENKDFLRLNELGLDMQNRALLPFMEA